MQSKNEAPLEQAEPVKKLNITKLVIILTLLYGGGILGMVLTTGTIMFPKEDIQKLKREFHNVFKAGGRQPAITAW